MSHAELIRRLQALPAAQQAEVYDFVEFLASRQAVAQRAAPAPTKLSQSPLAAWLDIPLAMPGFTPLSREEANERPRVRRHQYLAAQRRAKRPNSGSWI